MSRVRRLVVAVWVTVAIAVLATGRSPVTAQDAVGGTDATGASDVTADLQALFDRTPDGGVIQLEAGGDYRVEGTLVLENRHDLRIEGNGARIFATTTGDIERSHIRIIGGSGFDVRNLEIQGANPRAGLEEGAYQEHLENQAGIRLDGVTDVELDRVHIHDVYGDLVLASRHEEDRRWTEQVWIHDSTLTHSGRQGIAVVAGRDIVIERNRLTNMARATIDLEPNGGSWGAENIHILDNQVGPGRLLFVAAGGGGPVNRVVIARNTLRGRPLNLWVIPREGERRQRFWVVDNASDTVALDAALQFTRTDGVIAHGNRQPTDERFAFVEATDSCDIAITENDIAPSTRILDGQSRQCNFIMPVQPPEPPPVAGRGQPPPPVPPTTAQPPPTTAPATTTSKEAAPPSSTSSAPSTEAPPLGTQLAASDTRGGDGVAGPVVVLAMVLAALAGAGCALAFSAWRGRR
jgi:Right handed beta helix region